MAEKRFQKAAIKKEEQSEELRMKPRRVNWQGYIFFLAPRKLRRPVRLNGEAKRCPNVPSQLQDKALVIGIEPTKELLLIANPEAPRRKGHWCRIAASRLEKLDEEYHSSLLVAARAAQAQL